MEQLHIPLKVEINDFLDEKNPPKLAFRSLLL